MLSAVVGINWGDEGKGRIVDYLAPKYDVVSRYQGGNNAGHTVVNDKGKFILNLLPSGILQDGTSCFIDAADPAHVTVGVLIDFHIFNPLFFFLQQFFFPVVFFHQTDYAASGILPVQFQKFFSLHSRRRL